MGKAVTKGVSLTKDQNHGAEAFNDWFVNKGFKKKPVLRIGGAAGTGKSFFVKYLCDTFDLNAANCVFVSYTGQAVNNLRQRGVPAKTIHSTFYEMKSVKLKDEKGRIIKYRGIPVVDTRFVPVDYISSKTKLIIVDESSFLAEENEKVMTSFNVPVLELGDPIQLPPVVGRQCFNMSNLDVFFDEVMRQNHDSEILEVATLLRNKESINIGKYHDDVLFLKPHENIEATFSKYRPFLKRADAIICATNKQRGAINELYREKIIKTTSSYPQPGEKLICRKNNWSLKLGDYPLTNGTIGTCQYDIPRSQIDRKNHTFYMDFKPSYISNDYYDNILCDFEFLDGPYGANKKVDKFNEGEKFEFAHAITTHLSQGAQFGNTVFFDSYRPDAEYMMRLRYTAVTRAVDRLVYILPNSNIRHIE